MQVEWRSRWVQWCTGCLICAVFLCIAGCAGVPQVEYGARLPTSFSDRVELQDVPFYSQEKYQCGPAALAMVLTYAGAPHTPNDLTEQVYLPQRKGSLQPELLAAIRRAGLLAYTLDPEPAALLQELAAGHPVVVLLNLRFDFFPEWHYAVLIGYDLTGNKMIMRSGTDERIVMSLVDFDRAWAKANHWAFVALPPNQIPATVNESTYVEAATALERVSPESSQVAYTTALARWPANLIARIGLGNEAYRRHELTKAELEYRQAVVEHPNAADAWNNLAQVLHEQAFNPAALEAAERAVAIGGPRQATYESTRALILDEIAH